MHRRTLLTATPPSPRGLWRRIRVWVLLSVLAATAGFVVYFIGVFSGGLDIGETCARLGQPYDDAYRATHWEEPSRFFPLHNRCNAAFDVVPAWVNPALVCFAALTVIGAVVAVVMGTARIVAAVRRSPARIK